MSRFQKLSHVLWYCQYHIVFVPKYRYRVLTGVTFVPWDMLAYHMIKGFHNKPLFCLAIYCLSAFSKIG